MLSWRKILISAAGLFMIAGCNKAADSGLTDVSVSGEYFNCRINGKYWTYTQCTYWCSDALKSEQWTDTSGNPVIVYITGGSSEYPQTQININIAQKDYLAGDTIMLSRNPQRLGGDSLSFAKIYSPFPVAVGEYGEYITDSVYTGRLIFTERTARWQRGTFSFVGANGDGKVVSITDGRFAISLD